MKKLLYFCTIIFLCSFFIISSVSAKTDLKTEVIVPKNFPLKVIDFKSSQGSRSGSGITDWDINVTVKNVSKKVINGFQLKCNQYNPFGERVSHTFETTVSKNIKPGESANAGWNTSGGDLSASKATLEIKKVLFQDGTIWQKTIDLGVEGDEVSPSSYTQVKYDKVINEAFVDDYLNKKVQFKCKFINVMPNKAQYAVLNYDSSFPKDMVFFRVGSSKASEMTLGYTMFSGLSMPKKNSDPLFEINTLENIIVYGTLNQFEVNNMKHNIFIVHAIDR